MMVDRGMRVLVVDEMTTMARSIARLLGELGFVNIDEIHDCRDAMRLLAVRRYGLVLSDWEMSPVTGFELLRTVRADPAMKSLPFILVTSEVRVEKVIAARQAGVSGYLVKPFSDALLKQKLVGILGDF